MSRVKFEGKPTQCAGCPEIFTPTHYRQTFHSPECLKEDKARRREEVRAARPAIEKQCEVCGSSIPETKDSLVP